jgi:hypothetical protein
MMQLLADSIKMRSCEKQREVAEKWSGGYLVLKETQQTILFC